MVQPNSKHTIRFIRQYSNFILALLISLIIFWHTAIEKTFYYWDFGDYQAQLIELTKTTTFKNSKALETFVSGQLTEYPLNWALPFLFLPFPIFDKLNLLNSIIFGI